MMKKHTIFRFLSAAVLAAAFLGLSCSRLEELQEEIPAPEEQEETTVFTLTVQADKGLPTKALTEALDGKTIESTWTAGDKVKVFNYSGTEIGELEATGSGITTTLSGSFTTPLEMDDNLTLVFQSEKYNTQLGTLDYIAANCDYATAEVTVTAKDGTTISTDEAHFESRQAIAKFTLKTGEADLLASQLLVTVGTTTYTVNPASATSVIYVALPAFTGQTFSLSAKSGSSIYELFRPAASFENGAFYRITAGLAKQLVGGLTISGLGLNPPAYNYAGASLSGAR